MSEDTGRLHTVEEVAAGFIQIANENMVKPIKAISVARGYDVQEYALCCFGGAGAQHACAVAEALGIRNIAIHPLAGVLSAFGMGLARFSHTETRPLLAPLNGEITATLAGCFRDMEGSAAVVLAGDGVAVDQINFTRTVEARYQGADAAIEVPLEGSTGLEERFAELHQQRYGFTKPGHGVEVVNARLLAEGGSGTGKSDWGNSVRGRKWRCLRKVGGRASTCSWWSGCRWASRLPMGRAWPLQTRPCTAVTRCCRATACPARPSSWRTRPR